MSESAVAWAWKQTTGGPAAKSVLIALAIESGVEGACWASTEALAVETEQTEATVSARLLDLENLGLIARVSSPPRGFVGGAHIVVLFDDFCRDYVADCREAQGDQ